MKLARLSTLAMMPLVLLPLVLLAGCKPDPAVRTGEVVDRGVKMPVKPELSTAGDAAQPGAANSNTKLGTVRGTVSFSGHAPARVLIDMSMDPACAMGGESNQSEQYVVADGKLANVFVYVKRGAQPSQAPAGATPPVMDQHGCRYTPHVIALQQGGFVEFRNSDPTMHNIHTMPAQVGNQAVDVSQGPGGQPQTRQFNKPEIMMPVRCNNHPWMNAFVNVADTPYFAVSGSDGSFTIPGLPAGTYTLAAVHEKLGEQDVQITVPAKGSVRVNFGYAMH